VSGGLNSARYTLPHHESAAHDLARLGESLLELRIGLLLDCLGILQLFDQLHLKHLHLHNFLFLHLAETCLIIELSIDVPMYRLDSALFIFFYFQLCETFLL
jgi:hypothetical protein